MVEIIRKAGVYVVLENGWAECQRILTLTENLYLQAYHLSPRRIQGLRRGLEWTGSKPP